MKLSRCSKWSGNASAFPIVLFAMVPLVGCDNNVPFWGGRVGDVWTTDDGTGTTDDGSGTTGEISNLQVAVEVRFVTVEDDFFERIGVDFDFDLKLDSATPQTMKYQPEMSNDTDVAFTRELIPGSNQIDNSQEQFGLNGLPPDVSTNPFSGLTGAILDDIQLDALIARIQSDESANLIDAPKITLFNNQSVVTIIKNEVRDRADMQTNFIAAADDVDPLINPYITGPSIQIIPLVSADRRFVSITILPVLGALFNTPDVTGDRALVQIRPVQTQVSVPDGGTILIGGVIDSGDNKSNGTLPYLGNIPIVGRLFENRTVVMEEDELIIMITPRIIIQEAEE